MQRRTIELALETVKRRRVEEVMRVRRATHASADKHAKWQARILELGVAIVELEEELDNTS